MATAKIDLEVLGMLAREAGKAILEVYETDFAVEQKADASPLTLADRRSHQIISAGLQSRYPEVPVLSEEGKEVSLCGSQGMAFVLARGSVGRHQGVCQEER